MAERGLWPEGSNTRVPGSLVQKTAHRRRAFYEDQDARMSIMARADVPLRRIRLCTNEQSLTQPTCQRGGPYVFERPATAAEPDAQGAATYPDIRLRIETAHHLVERDVLLLLDHSDDEGCVRIEGRPTLPALSPGRPFADPGSPNPPDRGRYADPEPGGGLPCRYPVRRRLQNPRPQILAQRSGYHPPPSR